MAANLHVPTTTTTCLTPLVRLLLGRVGGHVEGARTVTAARSVLLARVCGLVVQGWTLARLLRRIAVVAYRRGIDHLVALCLYDELAHLVGLDASQVRFGLSLLELFDELGDRHGTSAVLLGQFLIVVVVVAQQQHERAKNAKY